MKMSAVGLISTILLMSSVCHQAEGKKIKDTIDIRSNWEFLTRFCFLSSRSTAGQGRLQYSLKYPMGYGVQNLVFYYDTPGQWESVYKRDKSCQDQFSVAADRNNYFAMEPAGGICSVSNTTGVPHYVCEGTLDFTSARERWWYVVVSRCGSASDPQYNDKLYLEVEMHMTNGEDFLHKEYSADEFYIVIIVIVFFVLYCALWIASLAVAYMLVQRQLYHSTYRMYLAALTLYCLDLFCLVIAWVSYGVTGYEKTSLETLGRVLGSASHITFMLTLILIAKGFTIVRGRLKTKAYIKITVFIAMYIFASVTLYIWEAVVMDPGLVLYFYESPPGYGTILLTLLGWLWFTKAAVFTLKHYKGKTGFYMMLYILYSIWFWAAPMMIMLAMFAMAKWTREKTVSGVEHLIAFVGHLFFFCLTLPSKVNSNFPYHVKTSQIGIDNSEQDSSREGEYTNITGAYWSTTGPNLDFFTTSKGSTSDGGPQYPPLPARTAGDQSSSRTNDSPPPPYPQAVALASNSDMATDASMSNHDNNQNISTISNSNMLPPLNTNEGLPLASRLPPLRGSGLPPLMPSAPGSEEPTTSFDNPNYNNPNLLPMNELYSQPVRQKNVSRMFQVSKEPSVTNETQQNSPFSNTKPISNGNLEPLSVGDINSQPLKKKKISKLSKEPGVPNESHQNTPSPNSNGNREPLSEGDINSQPLRKNKVSRMFQGNDREPEDTTHDSPLSHFLTQRKPASSSTVKTSDPMQEEQEEPSKINPNLLSDEALYSKLAPLTQLGPLPGLERKPKKKKKKKKIPKEPEPDVEPEPQDTVAANKDDEGDDSANRDTATPEPPPSPPVPDDPLNQKPLIKRKKKAKKFFINQ